MHCRRSLPQETDPIIDPLRKEPRFQVIERGLKFAD
jgi:hypothetical protein